MLATPSNAKGTTTSRLARLPTHMSRWLFSPTAPTLSSPPLSRLDRLPTPISRWLGYRHPPPPEQPEPQHIVWLWSWIGIFCGISVIQAVFGQPHYFIERGVPGIVASYGSSVVLIYGSTTDADIAQPRALFGGHFLSALVGICITKLFHLLLTEEQFEKIAWLAGSSACATAAVVMQMTKVTMHPPAGPTALLAAVNPEIRAIGWYYLPVVLLSSVLTLVVALLVNNIQRRYPAFWFFSDVPVVVETKELEVVRNQESPQTTPASSTIRGNEAAEKV